MTYILGLSQPKINSIIADARVTYVNSPELCSNSSLKTGLLFPGCIYGYTGSVVDARSFIVGFKKELEKNPIENLAQALALFEKYVEGYRFPRAPSQHFTILISRCDADGPRFYTIDSIGGISVKSKPGTYGLISLGSGKELLDSIVLASFLPRMQKLQEFLLSKNLVPPALVPSIAPYFLCLWLSELSLTSEATVLNKHGVGGAFHFLYQTAELDSTQFPAVYLFNDTDRQNRRVFVWGFRVLFACGGLIVEENPPPGQSSDGDASKGVINANFDEAARLGVSLIPKADLDREVRKELSEVPFYYFCGVGYTNPKERTLYGFGISSNGKKEDIFPKPDKLAEWISKPVFSNLISGTEHPKR